MIRHVSSPQSLQVLGRLDGGAVDLHAERLQLDEVALADVLGLLEELVGVVRQVGGAVYPAKDARMSGESFRAFFPAWEKFARQMDPRFSSSFWRRVSGS